MEIKEIGIAPIIYHVSVCNFYGNEGISITKDFDPQFHPPPYPPPGARTPQKSFKRNQLQKFLSERAETFMVKGSYDEEKKYAWIWQNTAYFFFNEYFSIFIKS